MSAQNWEEIGAKKRAALSESIPQEWRVPANLLPPDSQDNVTNWPATSGWFTDKELEITEQTMLQLLPKLASGELKSATVTMAFCKRAAAAHQLTNCLSETLFDRAMTMARARDEHFAKTGKTIGPLHGLPISLKDNFKLKGLDATVGFSAHVGDAAADDAALAKILEKAGAVFYVKTNVPTAMMIAETVNNVFGRTLNPLNRRTTCGGSSGGESALLVMKGSPIGVGTDIGGSLRIPAACTGTYTLRPSGGRFPVRDCRSGLPGQEAVMSVNGPLARTLEDVIYYSKVVVDSQPWLHDTKCHPIPWRAVDVPKKLKIGVMWNDGLVQPTPPIARALRETVDKLKAAGHEIIDWDPIDIKQGENIIVNFFVADGGESIGRELNKTGEPWRPEMLQFRDAKALSMYELWQLQAERTDFQNKNIDRWNETGIDALLQPTMAYVTIEHGKARHIPYTSTYNVLDYSAVSFPTGAVVDKNVDRLEASYTPFGDQCQKINQEYDGELLDGMPISLQLIARKLEEEKALAMTEQIIKDIS